MKTAMLEGASTKSVQGAAPRLASPPPRWSTPRAGFYGFAPPASELPFCLSRFSDQCVIQGEPRHLDVAKLLGYIPGDA